MRAVRTAPRPHGYALIARARRATRTAARPQCEPTIGRAAPWAFFATSTCARELALRIGHRTHRARPLVPVEIRTYTYDK
jgi:hypothetical protein